MSSNISQSTSWTDVVLASKPKKPEQVTSAPSRLNETHQFLKLTEEEEAGSSTASSCRHRAAVPQKNCKGLNVKKVKGHLSSHLETDRQTPRQTGEWTDRKDILQYRDCILIRSQSDTVGPWSTESPAAEAEPASRGWTGRHGDSHRYWGGKQTGRQTKGKIFMLQPDRFLLFKYNNCSSNSMYLVVVVVRVVLTAGTCAAPSSCTGTSGTDGRRPEPVETWCYPTARHQHSRLPRRHAPSLTCDGQTDRQMDEKTDRWWDRWQRQTGSR